MKKKIFMLIFALVFALPLAFYVSGCGNEDEVQVEKTEVAVPTLTSSTEFEYDATEKTLTFDGLDEIANLVRTTGQSSATDFGNYEFTITLKDPTQYIFANGKTSITYSWRIVAVEYTLTISGNAKVVKNGVEITSGAIVYFGDELTVSYKLDEGYLFDAFTVNGEAVQNGATVQVGGPVAVVFAQRVPTVTELAQYAFDVTDEDNHEVNVRAINATQTMTIPKFVDIDGTVYTVTSIKVSGFQGAVALENVTIPSSVTVIGDHAFYQCNNLTSVELPENLETIGVGSFRETAITSVIIPSSVTEIGETAFEACNNLTSVTFEEGCELVLPSSIFVRCENLETVTLASTMNRFSNKAFNQSNDLTTIIWNGKLTVYAPDNSDAIAPFDAVFAGQSAGAVFIEEEYDSSILTQLYVDVSGMEQNPYTLEQIIQAYNLFAPYLYSETEPQVAGNYWHYVENTPTIWA